MNTKKLAIHELSNGIKTLNSISIPDKVNNLAKRLIVDIFGVTLAGSNTDSSNIFYNVANDIYSSGKCKIIGRDTTINAAGAAFINGTSAHALDFDDNCYAGVVHGSAVVFPAVLSYAQHKNLSGDNLLKSFIIGISFIKKINFVCKKEEYSFRKDFNQLYIFSSFMQIILMLIECFW